MTDEPEPTMNLADRAKQYEGMDAGQLRHLLAVRDTQIVMSRKFWVRAGKKALEGDTRELRNRIDLAESPPMDIVLS